MRGGGAGGHGCLATGTALPVTSRPLDATISIGPAIEIAPASRSPVSDGIGSWQLPAAASSRPRYTWANAANADTAPSGGVEMPSEAR